MNLTDRAAIATVNGIVRAFPSSVDISIFHRGAAPFWETLSRTLASANFSVSIYELDHEDFTWAPPTATGAGRILWRGGHSRCDLVLYHEPFMRAASEETEPVGQLRELFDNSIRFVTLAFPHGIRGPGLRERLEHTYHLALERDWRAVELRAESLARLLDASDTFDVVQPDGGCSMRVQRPFNVRTDMRSMVHDAPIIQLPLGEMWVAFDAHGAAGELDVLESDEHSLLRLDFPGKPRNGVPANDLPGLVCEVGVGTNEAALWLPSQTLSEKAHDRIHLGFGDNRLIGGQQIADGHFDLPASRATELWANSANGERWQVVPRAAREDLEFLCQKPDGALTVLRHYAADGDHVGRHPEHSCDLHESGVRLIASLSAPNEYWPVQNLDELAQMNSASSEDLILIHKTSPLLSPSAGASLRGERDSRNADFEKDPLTRMVWDHLVARLGESPWGPPCIVWTSQKSPLGISFPGVILLSDELLDQPLRARWLYLTHEYIHQWVGGMVRIESSSLPFFEALIDVLAWDVASVFLGERAKVVFTRLMTRYAASPNQVLRERADEFALALQTLDPDEVWPLLRQSISEGRALGRARLQSEGRTQ